MTETEKNVLILCAGNSARSIMAEAILNARGIGRVRCYSAGSKPESEPHPLAIAQLKTVGLDPSPARSKSWLEFTGPNAPKMDFIFTVCASAAGEACPVWPGSPAMAHWGIPDPVIDVPHVDLQRQAFASAYAQLLDRMTLFLGIDFDHLKGDALQARLDAIGRIDDDARIATGLRCS